MPANVIDQELEAVRSVGAPVHRLVGVPLNHRENRHVLRYLGRQPFIRGSIWLGWPRFVTTTGCASPGTLAEEVKTSCETIRAQHAVVATSSSISDRFAIHTKTAPYRTYFMAFEIKRGALPDALWDTEEPYHYVRSGRADDANERFKRLETWARELISGLGKETHRWSDKCSILSTMRVSSAAIPAAKIFSCPWEIRIMASRMALPARC